MDAGVAFIKGVPTAIPARPLALLAILGGSFFLLHESLVID